MKNVLPFILFLALLSCKQEKEPILETDTHFNYTSYLLSHKDSVPTLEIEFDQPDSLFFKKLNKRLMPNGCETFKDFNINIDSLTIAARVAQPCGIPIYCGIKLNIEVLINKDNKILVEQDLITNTSDLNRIANEIIKDEENCIHINILLH